MLITKFSSLSFPDNVSLLRSRTKNTLTGCRNKHFSRFVSLPHSFHCCCKISALICCIYSIVWIILKLYLSICVCIFKMFFQLECNYLFCFSIYIYPAWGLLSITGSYADFFFNKFQKILAMTSSNTFLVRSCSYKNTCNTYIGYRHISLVTDPRSTLSPQSCFPLLIWLFVELFSRSIPFLLLRHRNLNHFFFLKSHSLSLQPAILTSAQ